jgi:hypothetical protein
MHLVSMAEDEYYDDEYLWSQQEALVEHEAANKRRRLEDLESQALAQALASSENDWIQTSARQERESEQVARHVHQDELQEADQELAQVIDGSAKEFQVHQTNHQRNESLVQDHVQKTADRHTGCWDCPNCTFTNDPYHRQCGVCKSQSPAQILTFSNVCELRFGLEIEIVVPQGKRDGFSLAKIANQLTKLGPPRVEFVGYSTETSVHWKIVPDSSLQGGQEDLCFELVSPILQGDGDGGLRDLRVVLENLRCLGIATNTSCGFHVHVDATPRDDTTNNIGTLRGVQKVARCFLALENAFDLLVALSWETMDNTRRANQNRYCRSNRLALGEVSNRQRWDRINSTRSYTQLVKLVSPDRYRKLNLTNIIDPNRPSTCEFRNHGGVEDLKEAEAWVRLLLRFCERGSSQDDSKCLLPQGASPKDELRALFELLDCTGLEQYFVVERRLFSESRMLNPWICTVCERVFRDSRSLSQHSTATNHHR